MLLLLDQITSHNPFLLRLCSFARQLHTQVCAFLTHSRSSYNTNSARNCLPILALILDLIHYCFLVVNLFLVSLNK